MVVPWITLTVLVLLGWSTWREKQGHSGWFRGWIPKQHATLRVNWTNERDEETKPTLVHFHMNTDHHWWIRSASALLILTASLLGMCVYGVGHSIIYHITTDLHHLLS